MRSGIAFPHRQAHAAAHLRPLMDRLHDVLASQPGRARVVVQAESRPPVRGAWNVQVFHGLADAGRPSTQRALQGRRFLRADRHSRYQQVNAHGPRWADLLEGMPKDAEVSRFGHTALNETGGAHTDPDGPLLWLPTWDRRARSGGANPSSLGTFTDQVLAIAADVPVLLKVHPLTAKRGHAAKALRRLAGARNVTVAPATESPYRLLEGCRGVLADAGSLGLEAYCLGLPVALARNPGVEADAIHAELAERAPVFAPGERGLAEWALAPPPPAGTAWARDLLYAPDPRRNDAFAARLRERAMEAR